MKHIGRILLLTMMLLALGIPALAVSFVYEDVFEFEYPRGWVNYGVDSSEDIQGEYYDAAFVGGKGDDDLCLSVTMYYEDEYDDIRMFSDGEQTAQDLLSLLESLFYEMQWSDIVKTDAHGIPFAVVHGVDSGGDCLYAETVNNGWTIAFWGYAYTDGNYDEVRTLTPEDEETFLRILRSFRPVIKEGGR